MKDFLAPCKNREINATEKNLPRVRKIIESTFRTEHFHVNAQRKGDVDGYHYIESRPSRLL